MGFITILNMLGSELLVKRHVVSIRVFLVNYRCLNGKDQPRRHMLLHRAGIHGDFFRDSMDVNSREIVSHETPRAMEQRETSPKISRVNSRLRKNHFT